MRRRTRTFGVACWQKVEMVQGKVVDTAGSVHDKKAAWTPLLSPRVRIDKYDGGAWHKTRTLPSFQQRNPCRVAGRYVAHFSFFPLLFFSLSYLLLFSFALTWTNAG